jgi:hypothetical protein
VNELNERAARILVKSLLRGTIRPGGAKFIHQGHEKWLGAQLEELEEIAEDGGAVVHFVRGAYGEGKTHFLNYLEELARDCGWATAHLECRHDRVELDKFESIYPVIIKKLRLSPDSLKSEDEGSEDPAKKLLNFWSKQLFQEVGYREEETIKRPFETEVKLFDLVQERVAARNLDISFQRVLCAYPRAVLKKDYNVQSDLIAWFRGEREVIYIPRAYLSIPGQRVNAPGADPKLINPIKIRPITASTSLEVFQGLLWLLKICNFKGLILSIDEVEQIARIMSKRRERSLQTLREFVDNTDCDGGLQNVAIYFAATPNMFDDEDYFRSYDALATRIEPVSDEINWRAPVIDLEKTMLTREQLYWIASRIRWIHGIAYEDNLSKMLTDSRLSEIVEAVDRSRYRIAKPRLLCRSVVDELERLRQGRELKAASDLVSQMATLLLQKEES